MVRLRPHFLGGGPPPNAWGWIAELSAETLREVGEVCDELFLRGSDWVQRRVETVEFVDDTTIRRRLSVDFTLPKHLPTPLRVGRQRVFFIPLTVLPREPELPEPRLMYIDVRDERDAAVPLLTRRENSRITVNVLIARAESVVRAAGLDTLDGGVRETLARIAVADYEVALPLIRQVINPASEEWRQLASGQHDRCLLAADDGFRDLVALFAGSSLICVPLVARAGERRIIKLAYDERIATRAVGRGIDLPRLLRWRATPSRFEVSLVGRAETHHLQIATPRDVEMTEAGLIGLRPRDLVRSRVYDGGAAEPPDVAYERVEYGFRSRVHLYLPRAHDVAVGSVWVNLRAERQGFLRGAAASSVIIFAVLILFWAQPDAVVSQATAAAALLLLAPGLLVAYSLGRAEHAIARQLLTWPRRLIGIDGALIFAAATVLIVLAPSTSTATITGNLITSGKLVAPSALTWSWLGLAIAAGLIGIALVLSWWLPRAPQQDEEV